MTKKKSSRSERGAVPVETIGPEDVRPGLRVSFVPAVYEYEPDPARPGHSKVERRMGRIVQVNRSHRWFSVEATIRGRVYRESFKF